MTLNDDDAVERTVELDVPADELWRLISTPDGWSEWLADSVELTIAPDAEGTVSDAGVRKQVRIGQVDERRSISFEWWDEGSSRRSSVDLRIDHHPHDDEHPARLRIVERRLPEQHDGVGLHAQAALRTDTRTDRQLAWDVRIWLVLAAVCAARAVAVS